MLLPKTYSNCTGLDRNRNHIWEAREVKDEEDGRVRWLCTGRNELLLFYPDLRMALNYLIGAYPGTEGIDFILSGGPDVPAQYVYVDLAAAARRTLIGEILGQVNGVPPAANQGQDSSS